MHPLIEFRLLMGKAERKEPINNDEFDRVLDDVNRFYWNHLKERNVLCVNG